MEAGQSIFPVKVHIIRIKNKPISSNCYVIYGNYSNKCITIDPGSAECDDLIQLLKSKNLVVEHILITHEHFDHIWGVNKLMDVFKCNLICSSECSQNIIQRKKNLSFFYDNIGFETYNATHLVEELNYQITWNDNLIEFLSTKGHSDGSICIILKGIIFTGDTIIQSKSTIVKLPGGDKELLSASLLNIKKKIKDNYIVYPGHGEPFIYSEYKQTEK